MPGVSRVGSLRNKITIQNTDIRTTDSYGGFTTAKALILLLLLKLHQKQVDKFLMKAQVKQVRTHIHLNF